MTNLLSESDRSETQVPEAIGSEAPNDRYTRLPYYRPIDGLRAVAIAFVLIYHADIGLLPGGFLGVEMFFVISGFLITGLLIGEFDSTNHINLGSFWRRRAKRLFPSLFAMLFVTTAFFAAFRPSDLARARGELTASIFYVQNWYLLAHESSYFDNFARPSPFEHLWSLAVEEQFYILWPLAILALVKVTRMRRGAGAAICVAGALASTILMAIHAPAVGADPSRAYLGTDVRASGLLLGAALAVVLTPSVVAKLRSALTSIERTLVSAAGALCLITVFAISHYVTDASRQIFIGGFLLYGSAIAALITSVLVEPNSFHSRILGSRALVAIGKRSYAIYLWYWPVYVLTRPQQDLQTSPERAFVLRLALTLLLAELTHRFVEKPVRSGAAGRTLASIRQSLKVQRLTPSRIALASFALIFGLTAFGGIGAATLSAQATPPPFTETRVRVGFEPTTPIAPTTAAGETPNTTTSIVVPTAAAPAAALPVVEWVPPAAPPGRIVAVGDSVLLGAAPALQTAFPGIGIDAAVGRQPWDVPAVWAAIRADGVPIDVAIVAVGNNGHLDANSYVQTMAILADVPKVVWVTPAAPLAWSDQATALLRNETPVWGTTRLADWAALWPTCGEGAFRDDYVHLTPLGASCYANTILVTSIQ